MIRLLPVAVGTLIVPFDTAVNVAFPNIAGAFGFAVPEIQWLIICYVLTYGSLMLAVGRIGDILGYRRVFRFGLIWSAVALLLCGLAPDYPSLLVCRGLQGVGAAFVIGCGPALATSLFPEAMRARALAGYAAAFAAASALGPLLGGVMVHTLGWPSVFWMRVPVALLALWLLRRLPETPPAAGPREPFDAWGAVLLAAMVATLLLAINRAPGWLALPLALMALLCCIGFVAQSRRVAYPILDLGLFLRPGFARLNIASLLVNLAGFGIMLLVPFFLTRVTALPTILVGILLGSGHLGAMLGSWLGGRLGGGWRCAWVGAALGSAGLLLTSRWSEASALPHLLGPLLVQGFGIGLFTLAYTNIVTATMRREDRGVAGSLALLTRTFGIVLAASLLTLVFSTMEHAALLRGEAAGAAFLGGFQAALLISGLLPLLALMLILKRPKLS